VGVVAGIAPTLYNEGVSSSTRKVTGFADFRRCGGTVCYSTDASFHRVMPEDSLPGERTFIGWSQRLTFGRSRLDQRLMVDQDPATGEWGLTRLRVRGSFAVTPGVSLHAGFGRSRPRLVAGFGTITSPSRDEASVGLSVFRRRTSASLDASVVEREGAGRGMAFSGSFSQAVRSLRLFATGRYWSDESRNAVTLSPGFGYRLGSVETGLRYQYYRVEGFAISTSQFGELNARIPLAKALFATVRAQRQWGTTYGSTRIFASLMKSF
jgi:hypothetical protein